MGKELMLTEVAARLGITRRAAGKLIERGTLTGTYHDTPVNKYWTVNEDALAAYMTNRRAPGRPAKQPTEPPSDAQEPK